MNAHVSDTEKDALSELFGALASEVRDLVQPAFVDEKQFDAAHLSQTQRRAVVRAVFAFVEGLSFALKQFALDVLNDRLSTAERALCREESYELSDNGAALTRPMRLRVLHNVRFALTIIPKASETPFTLDVSGEGWQSLRASLAVRDRLMHPKSANHLSVSDDDVRNTIAAYHWMQREMVRLFVDVIKLSWVRAGHPEGPGAKVDTASAQVNGRGDR